MTMNDPERPLLTDEQIEEAHEGIRRMTAQRRQWDHAEAVVTALQGAKHYFQGVKRDAVAIMAQAAAQAGTILADAERAKRTAELRVTALETKEAEIQGRIAGANETLAQREGKVAEATATIRQGEEWQQKMDEAAKIAQRR